MRFSEETGSDASVIGGFLNNSRHRRDWALRMLHEKVLVHTQVPKLGVLGLSYKENTHSTKNSPSFALIAHLHPWPLRVYDPVVPASAVPHPAVTASSSALDAARHVDALMIMTPWPEFRALAPRDLANAMTGKTVIDPYRLLDPREMRAAGLRHFYLGAPDQHR
jgi:UDPglucose 6-dehydrogenase